jgi:hypothetical protein
MPNPAPRSTLMCSWTVPACVIAAGLCATSAWADSASETAFDFVGSIGVCTHLAQGGVYSRRDRVINDLHFLGVEQVRDDLRSNMDVYAPLAKAGIKLDFIVGSDPDTAVGEIAEFSNDYPGSVSAVEGANEINNWKPTFTYKGLTGPTAAIPYQNDLYAATKASRLPGVAVYKLTGTRLVTQGFDFANLHIYAKNGDPPAVWLERTYSAQELATPATPIVMTETGYYTLPSDTKGWGGVDEDTQAKQILDTLFDAARLGFKKVYLYELLDEHPDPNLQNMNDHFGLFEYNNNPKTAAVALRNLIGIFATVGQERPTKIARCPGYRIEGLTSADNHFAVVKDEATCDIAIWSEPQIWNQQSHVPAAAPSHRVTVLFDRTIRGVKIYSPIDEPGAIAEQNNANRIDLTLSDKPIIAEVRGIPDN